MPALRRGVFRRRKGVFRRRKGVFRKRLGGTHARGRRHANSLFNYGQRIVPDTMYTKLRFPFGGTITVDSVNGAGAQAFRGNSLFDPDATGTGSQPLGFDEYATFYTRYRVIGCKIKVTAVNQNAGTDEQIILVLVPQKSQDVGSGAWVDRMDPYARKMLVPTVEQGYAKSIQGYMSTAKMMGLSKAGVSDRDFSALTSASPLTANQWFWNVVCATFDNNTPTSNVNVAIVCDLTYYVKFMERKNLSES